jgi:hypothetical protein
MILDESIKPGSVIIIDKHPEKEELSIQLQTTN